MIVGNQDNDCTNDKGCNNELYLDEVRPFPELRVRRRIRRPRCPRTFPLLPRPPPPCPSPRRTRTRP